MYHNLLKNVKKSFDFDWQLMYGRDVYKRQLYICLYLSYFCTLQFTNTHAYPPVWLHIQPDKGLGL